MVSVIRFTKGLPRFRRWGAFNLVEGIIDHQILGIHYVRQVPNYTVYNLSFVAIGGVLFIAIGWLLMKPANPPAR
jgi:uncharacterized membrane protein